MECFRLLFDHLAWIEHQFLSGIRDSRKAGILWGMMRGVGGVRKSIYQSWLAKGLGLLCWGFKRVYEEIPSEEASTLQIGSVAFLAVQCTSPQLHPCQRLFDQDGHQDSSLTLTIILALLPVTFAYSLSSQAVVMRQLRWKRLWRRSLTRSHKRTSIGPYRSCWNVTTMHCSRRRLLRRGLEFHVCTINKSVHTIKVWKLISWSSYFMSRGYRIVFSVRVYLPFLCCCFWCLTQTWFTQNQSEPGNNNSKGVLHAQQISRTGASPANAV